MSVLRRVLGWDELRGFWRLRRELLKESLRIRERCRRVSRSVEDSLKLALLAREGFKKRLEVVEFCGSVRVLRMRG